MIGKIITILFMAVVLAGCQGHPTSHDVSNLNWSLEIDQPIGQLEEILDTLEQQQPRNYTIANISFLYELKLYLVFQEYVESLPVAERSGAILEQSEWMELHRQKVDEAYAEYEGGTFAGYNAGVVSIGLLKWRISELSE